MRQPPRIMISSCRGCHECLDCCPADAIRYAPEGLTISESECVKCGSCIRICRFGAIAERF